MSPVLCGDCPLKANYKPYINPFTPKSDQLQFSLSVSHQRYIIQYGEFGNAIMQFPLGEFSSPLVQTPLECQTQILINKWESPSPFN